MTTLDLRNGDSRELLRTLPENSVDSCCTDPPYDLTSIVKRYGSPDSAEQQFGTDGAFKRLTKGFMNQAWDGTGIAFDPAFWIEVYRVLKPGAHLLAFGGTRTQHRMVTAIEMAGFEIRDQIAWHYASGFPKSHDVAHGIDKLNGSAGNRGHAIAAASKTQPNGRELPSGGGLEPYHPISDEAGPWQGWGTALKPSSEPICVARKPLSESSVARNVLRWGVGAINIDGCRIETDETLSYGNREIGGSSGIYGKCNPQGEGVQNPQGRWPANTILVCPCDGEHLPGCHVREMDEQSGILHSGANPTRRNSVKFDKVFSGFTGQEECNPARGADSGGASRFFFVAKPSQRERGEGNIHPTVKPVQLLKYLQRLVTPPGGVTLDPFMGSGTAGIAAQWEGFRYIGFEREEAYFRIACDRTCQWESYEEDAKAPALATPISPQRNLFD